MTIIKVCVCLEEVANNFALKKKNPCKENPKHSGTA